MHVINHTYLDDDCMETMPILQVPGFPQLRSCGPDIDRGKVLNQKFPFLQMGLKMPWGVKYQLFTAADVSF